MIDITVDRPDGHVRPMVAVGPIASSDSKGFEALPARMADHGTADDDRHQPEYRPYAHT